MVLVSEYFDAWIRLRVWMVFAGLATAAILRHTVELWTINHRATVMVWIDTVSRRSDWQSCLWLLDDTHRKQAHAVVINYSAVGNYIAYDLWCLKVKSESGISNRS